MMGSGLMERNVEKELKALDQKIQEFLDTKIRSMKFNLENHKEHINELLDEFNERLEKMGN